MQKVIVVGGGIIGTLHAWEARLRGLEVLHLEADLEPRSATVRNLGMIWVTGRATGAEMDLVLRGRTLWEEIGKDVPGVNFRPSGALTVLYTDAEVAVARQAIEADSKVHDYRLLDPDAARALNPILGGDFAAALHCPMDALIEPKTVLPAMRAAMAGPHYTWKPGITAVDIAPGVVRDQYGTEHRGDLILLCVGSATTGATAQLLAKQPLERCRLQMLETEPIEERLGTVLSDSLSMHYYPVYDVPAKRNLPPRDPFAEKYGIKLMVAQRADGALTIGDTHLYDEPFDFAATEACYEYILDRFAKLTGRPAPAIRRRWTGTYTQRTDKKIFLRVPVAEGVYLATGIGGRGMGTAPAIAQDTFDELEAAGVSPARPAGAAVPLLSSSVQG